MAAAPDGQRRRVVADHPHRGEPQQLGPQEKGPSEAVQDLGLPVGQPTADVFGIVGVELEARDGSGLGERRQRPMIGIERRCPAGDHSHDLAGALAEDGMQQALAEVDGADEADPHGAGRS